MAHSFYCTPRYEAIYIDSSDTAEILQSRIADPLKARLGYDFSVTDAPSPGSHEPAPGYFIVSYPDPGDPTQPIQAFILAPGQYYVIGQSNYQVVLNEADFEEQYTRVQ